MRVYLFMRRLYQLKVSDAFRLKKLSEMSCWAVASVLWVFMWNFGLAAVDVGLRHVQGEVRTAGDPKDSRQSVIQQFPASLQRPTSVVQNGGE